MRLRVASEAECNQIFLDVRALRAPSANMMDLQVLRSATILAFPGVPLKHGLAKRLVSAGIKPQPRASPSRCHDAFLSRSAKVVF